MTRCTPGSLKQPEPRGLPAAMTQGSYLSEDTQCNGTLEICSYSLLP